MENIDKEIQVLKKQGYTVYALMRGEDSKDIFKEKFKKPALFLIGGEKRGINAQSLKLSDTNLYIPYGSDFRNALNASNALAVVSTLLFAQRKK